MDSDGIWGFGDNGARPKKRSRTAEKLRQQKINGLVKRMKDPTARANYKSLDQQRRGMNCPPSDNEDEFDIADIQGSLKRQMPECSIVCAPDAALPPVKCTASNHMPHDALEMTEAKESAKLLKVDVATKKPKYETRRKNESKRSYTRRVRDETTCIIKQTKMAELNHAKRKRKKEFLNKRKKGKRPAKGSDGHHFLQIDAVPFGHQVQRPPNLKSLPRGASLRTKKTNTSKREMNVEAEQENLERMRQRVQEQYAIIKAKRKKAGEFHL